MSSVKEYRLKHLFIKRIGGAWGTEPDDDSVICLRAADIETDQMIHKSNDLTYRTFSDNELNSRKLSPGDIIIEKSGGGENQPVGRVAKFVLNEAALCSNFLDLLRPNNKIVNTDYLTYILYYLWKNRTVVKSIKQTTGIQNLDIEDYLNNKANLPSLEQQNKIVNYLDREIAKIDALIEKKTKLITLLEEKKKAVINQAVTKGLDTTVAMKDSGIEWLGEIPQHWEVVKLKYLSKNIDTGSTPNGYDIPIEELNENVWNWFTPGDFNEDFNFVNESKRKLSFEVVEDNKVRLYDTNSVMFVGIGATLGKIAVTGTNFYTNQQINIIELNNDINKMFVAYSLSAKINVSKMLANSATLPILNQQKLGDIQIPIPDLNEQILVVEHLENIYLNHFNTVNKISISIELLKEKRTAIISAAINGEIAL